MNDKASTQSGLRLRLGILLILLWWLPIWLLSPAISDMLGYQNNPTAQHRVFIILILAQTICGLAGVILASREVVTLLKSVPRRRVLPTIWHILWTGRTDDLRHTSR